MNMSNPQKSITMKRTIFSILLIAAYIITVSTTQVLAQEKVSVFNEIYDFSAKMEEKCTDVAEEVRTHGKLLSFDWF